MVAGEVLAAGHTAEIHCGGGKGAGRGAVALGSVVKPSHLLHREWHRPKLVYNFGRRMPGLLGFCVNQLC
jgi:hypothetical protein